MIMTQWFKTNKEKWNAYQREWRSKNKDKIAKYNKTYKKNVEKKLIAKITARIQNGKS